MIETMSGPHAQTALDYMNFVKGDAPRTLAPDFTIACWDELARYVDTQRFVRVSKHGETMSWPEAVDLMHRSIGGSKTYVLRGATEVGQRVFLELEETVSRGEGHMIFDSVYIFTFDDAGRIVRLEVFIH